MNCMTYKKTWTMQKFTLGRDLQCSKKFRVRRINTCLYKEKCIPALSNSISSLAENRNIFFRPLFTGIGGTTIGF